MSGCPFSTVWAVKDASNAPSAPADFDLRHSHSSVHLPAQVHKAEADVTSLSRAISTPHLNSDAPPGPPASTTFPASNSSAPAEAAQAARSSSGAAAAATTAFTTATGPQDPSSSAGTAPRLTRRQLRRLGRCWSLAEVRQHARKDDAWIAVDGKVYDITEHLVNHPGWEDSSAISTVLSILAHSGTDCSQEFREIHRPYPVAWRQLQAYYIGDLAPEGAEAEEGTSGSEDT